MSIGIAVIAYNRPDYLYICLDALSRVSGIEEYDVRVFFDGGLTESMLQAQEDVLSAFPLAVPYFHDTSQPTGILQSVTRALYMMSKHYDRIFYLEDDHLVRPDVLNVIEATQQSEYFLCLSGGSEYTSADYRAKGNVVSAENAQRLYHWIEDKMYYGLARRDGVILGADTTSHDAVYCTYLIHEGEQTQFVNGFYLAHFGLIGQNSWLSNASPEKLEFHRLMLSGPKKSWLQNTIDILQDGAYSDDIRLFAMAQRLSV